MELTRRAMSRQALEGVEGIEVVTATARTLLARSAALTMTSHLSGEGHLRRSDIVQNAQKYRHRL
jgi:hypothetical protein